MRTRAVCWYVMEVNRYEGDDHAQYSLTLWRDLQDRILS